MLKIILDRRTIRQYKNSQVNETMLNQILKAGIYAPFASKEIPIKYIVCKDKNVLKDLNKIHPYGKAMETAPVAVVLCGDKELEQTKGMLMVDCAAATENMLLAASSFGLGSCWMGLYPWGTLSTSVKEYFKLPENVVPFSIVTLGYADETSERPERTLDSIVHYNEW